ncbi:sigma factor [Rhodococcus opacus]|uniref:sigma factor n=1 Tax=Rhodococcus opacus TaxID=37919 RepID=UPI001FF8EF5A|nr:sigma factor [Rhodococcus opacus]MDX5970198.1 sigma factor [Rhodococcus opacus]
MDGNPSRWIELEDEARKIARNEDDQNLAEFSSQLENQIRSRYPRISQLEAQEITQDVLLRYLKLRDANKLDPDGNPYGYLQSIIRTTVIDRHRRDSRLARYEETLDPARLSFVLGDRNIDDPFHDSGTIHLVQAALSRAVEAKDYTAFRVAVCFLDKSESDGRTPSNRAIADELQVSHTGVAKALKRFRDYVIEISGSV